MCSVVERIGGYRSRSIFGRFVLLSSHRKALQTASPQVKFGLYSGGHMSGLKVGRETGKILKFPIVK